MNELLEITNQDIAVLEDGELRNLIGLLCEADYRSNGLSTRGIQWGGHQDSPDGGIDVLIKSNVQPPEKSYVLSAHTIFQSKKSDMKPAQIRKEMQSSKILKDSIANLAKDEGAYIIASSQTITGKVHFARERMMKEIVSGHSIKVAYYDGGRIATWVRNHPSLILWVRSRAKRPIYGWVSYTDWAGNLLDNEGFILDAECRIIDKRKKDDEELSVEEGISEFRKLLSVAGSYLRLTGLSGVGKTRFAQALFDHKINVGPINHTNIFYTDISNSPLPSPQNVAEQIIALGCPAILIIDNCSPELHRSLVAICCQRSHLISLLTIEYDVADDQPEETVVFHMEPASEEVVGKIVQRRYPNIGQIDSVTIARISGGNARVAIALARTIGAGDSIGGLSDNQLFKRLFHQRNVENHDLQHSAEALSLVYSFNIENSELNQSELGILGKIVSKEPQVLFRDTVELQRRDLVQARGRYRAVLPHAIANRFAKNALEYLSIAQINKHLLTKGNERLILSFTKRLSFLPESEAVKEIVYNWFSPHGWMQDISDLSAFGMSVLENLASIIPELTLTSCENAARQLPEKFASRENKYFYRFVRILRHIAYEEHLFVRSTNLIIEFALTEEVGENTNSIVDQLKSMFQSRLSGTHASIELRLQSVSLLWRSETMKRQQLATVLMKSSLEAWHFTSIHNPAFGVRSRNYGLIPQSEKEIEKWYTLSVELCLTMIESKSQFSNTVKVILASKLRGIWTKARLFTLVESVCKRIIFTEYWGQGWFKILTIIKYDANKESEDIKERLLTLELSLRPKNIYEEVRAFLFSGATGSDLSEVFNMDDGKKGFENIVYGFEKLGTRLAVNTEIFNFLLPELLSSGNRNVFHLGRGLYKGTVNKKDVWNNVLLSAYLNVTIDERKTDLLEGWVNSAHCESELITDEILDKVIEDSRYRGLFIPLQSEIPVNQKGLLRLLHCLESEWIAIKDFKLIAYRLVFSDLSDDDILEFIALILTKTEGNEVALEIIYAKCHALKSRSASVINDKLLDAARAILLDIDLTKTFDDDWEYNLTTIMSVCYVGENSFVSASHFTAKLLEIKYSDDYLSNSYELIWGKLVELQPVCVLNTLLEYGDKVNFFERNIFRSRTEWYNDLLSLVSDEILLDWCKDDPQVRFSLIAGSIISYHSVSDAKKLQWKPIFWKLVELAPNIPEVLAELENGFWPSVYLGSKAKNYEAKLPLFQELFQVRNIHMSSWARKIFEQLTVDIVELKKQEEERNRSQNESFE